MEEQKRCSDQAAKVVSKFEKDTGEHTINPQNHLDPRSGICYVSIYALTPWANGNLKEEEIVSDAFEGTLFGKFESEGAKTTWCYVLMPSGETKKCKDRGEFEDLTARYIKPGL
jgi:hypothetical protein